jgi:hypothetical protein
VIDFDEGEARPRMEVDEAHADRAMRLGSASKDARYNGEKPRAVRRRRPPNPAALS